MKLYTEEQVRKAMNDYVNTSSDLDNVMDVETAIIGRLTPIELPSDEEVEAQSKKWILGSQVWEKGAKWMREQILNQNNNNERTTTDNDRVY